MPFVPLPKEDEKHVCQHPEHNPPMHQVFPKAGHWVCPACGHKTFVPKSAVAEAAEKGFKGD